MAKRLPATSQNIANWALRRFNKIYPERVTVEDAAKWFNVPSKTICDLIGFDGTSCYIVNDDYPDATKMYFDFEGDF